MKIWVTRHGQTRLNQKKQMQGLTDEPLNEKGKQQALRVRELIGDVKFDAVYASPLIRSQQTASLIAGIPISRVLQDSRIIETDFGKYEQKSYYRLGPKMTCYWAVPEIFPTPQTVENIPSMVARSHSFLQELEKKDYENVLIVCHGGIIRVLCGYLEDRKNGIHWRPKPKNCEVRVYESIQGKHRLLRKILPEKEK